MLPRTVYKVKEIFYTLQGEGTHSGRPAVFCRFSGCNLWSGREQDRLEAICQFCDTDFRGTDGTNGGNYTAESLANKIISLWPSDHKSQVFVVCTGGEPALQLDDNLVNTFHQENIFIAIETNGTLPIPKDIDWVCVSPKAHTKIVLDGGDELKLVYPQIDNHPTDFEHLEFSHYYLQPLDGNNVHENTRKCIDYCLKNPLWKLSLQTHKILGID